MSAPEGGNKNKMVAIGVGILAILGLGGLGLFIFGPGLEALGRGFRGFMQETQFGFNFNAPFAILIFLIPVALLLVPLFMGLKSMLKGDGGGGDHH